MGILSKTKGKVGEREVAELLRKHGFEARRGQQFAGGGDSPDVVHSIPNIHIEVKRSETLALYAALEQADKDRRPGEDGVVFHRRNGEDWVVIMYAEVFLELIKEAEGLR